MSAKVGERVGMLLSADNQIVRMLGFGVRLEDAIPDSEVPGAFAATLQKHGITNPCLQIDSGVNAGKRVYGCECWWAPEEQMLALIQKAVNAGVFVETVSLDSIRKAPSET